MGFRASWADGITMSICNSIVPQFRLDVHRLTFVLNFNFIFQSAAVTGRRNSISKPAQSRVRYVQLLDSKLSLVFFLAVHVD